VGQTCRRRTIRTRAHSRSLLGGTFLSVLTARLPLILAGLRTPPVSHSPLPEPPACALHRGTPMTAHFLATTPAPEPFSVVHAHSLTPLAQLRPQLKSLALSCSVHAPVELRRRFAAVSWPSSNVCHVRCLDELCPFTRTPGHHPVCSQPL
jgi:hypothetical protein